MVCGDVDHCVQKLTSVIQEYGFNELLCWTRIGGLETRKVLRSMELMSGEIMPRVRRDRAAVEARGDAASVSSVAVA